MDTELRHRYRAWLRAHHPDAGGDREAFEAGLRAWRERLAQTGAAYRTDGRAPITFYRKPRGPFGRLAWGLTRRRVRGTHRRHHDRR